MRDGSMNIPHVCTRRNKIHGRGQESVSITTNWVCHGDALNDSLLRSVPRYYVYAIGKVAVHYRKQLREGRHSK